MNNKQLLEDLYEAIEEDNDRRVVFLISQGVNLNKNIEGREVSLDFAISNNKADIACEIIKALKDKINDDYLPLVRKIVKFSQNGSLNKVIECLDKFISDENKLEIYRKILLDSNTNDLGDNNILNFLRRSLNEINSANNYTPKTPRLI